MSEEEDRKTEQFFNAKPREDSQIGKRPPPLSGTQKIALGMVVAAIAGGIAVWQLRSSPRGTLWVMNPQLHAADIEVAGKKETAEPGKLLDLKVPLGDAVEVKITLAGAETKATVPVKDDSEQVTILDLGEGAYVIVDVSALYKSGAPPPESFAIKHQSAAASVHQLPFPGSKLVRPGRPLPDKGSWELRVFEQPGSSELEMYKVFRVDPKRLDDKDKLTQSLNEGLKGTSPVSYENLSVPKTRTGTAQKNSLIPRAGS